MKKQKRSQNGITLVALIITIIVMLILVTVTVSILINSNVIGTAKSAGERTKTAYGNESNFGESLTINVDGSTYNSIDEYLGTTGNPAAGTPVTNPASYGENAQATADGAGDYFALPTGATYVEGTVDTGVVISYKGSQFVWIPINSDLTVKGTNKLMAKASTGDYEGTTNGLTNYEGVLYDFVTMSMGQSGPTFTPIAVPQPMSSYGQGTTGCREPDTVSDYDGNTTYISTIGCETEAEVKDELQGSYNLMIDSVKKYGGFYVGRYESSIRGTTIASVKDATPMNNVNWYQMYQKQKAFSGSDLGDSMQSSMIWGSQYDAMLNWMLTGLDADKVNATNNAYHDENAEEPLRTGADVTEENPDIINNIYDLEGNCAEWTAEADGMGYRASRGGSYGYANPASVRFSNYPSGSYPVDSSRVALYIK